MNTVYKFQVCFNLLFQIFQYFIGFCPGDLGDVHADPTLAHNFLKWKAELTLDDMCADLWRWQSMNPNGYRPVDEKQKYI